MSISSYIDKFRELLASNVRRIDRQMAMDTEQATAYLRQRAGLYDEKVSRVGREMRNHLKSKTIGQPRAVILESARGELPKTLAIAAALAAPWVLYLFNVYSNETVVRALLMFLPVVFMVLVSWLFPPDEEKMVDAWAGGCLGMMVGLSAVLILRDSSTTPVNLYDSPALQFSMMAGWIAGWKLLPILPPPPQRSILKGLAVAAALAVPWGFYIFNEMTPRSVMINVFWAFPILVRWLFPPGKKEEFETWTGGLFGVFVGTILGVFSFFIFLALRNPSLKVSDPSLQGVLATPIAYTVVAFSLMAGWIAGWKLLPPILLLEKPRKTYSEVLEVLCGAFLVGGGAFIAHRFFIYSVPIANDVTLAYEQVYAIAWIVACALGGGLGFLTFLWLSRSPRIRLVAGGILSPVAGVVTVYVALFGWIIWYAWTASALLGGQIATVGISTGAVFGIVLAGRVYTRFKKQKWSAKELEMLWWPFTVTACSAGAGIAILWFVVNSKFTATILAVVALMIVLSSSPRVAGNPALSQLLGRVINGFWTFVWLLVLIGLPVYWWYGNIPPGLLAFADHLVESRALSGVELCIGVILPLVGMVSFMRALDSIEASIKTDLPYDAHEATQDEAEQGTRGFGLGSAVDAKRFAD